MSNVQEAGRLGHSDHCMVLASVATGDLGGGQQRPQPDWSKADWPAMREELSSVDWRKEMDGKPPCETWDILRDRVQAAVNKYVPARRKRNHNRPAWLSNEIPREIRRKKRLWTKAKSGEGLEEYKRVEKDVRNRIRKAKRKFEKKLASGGEKDGVKKRQFYAYVKQRTKCRPSIGLLKDRAGRMVQDEKEMAEMFNKFFNSMFTKENTDNVPDPQQQHGGEMLADVKITTKKVEEKVRKLRKGAAAGPDKIGPQLLQELVKEISSPLATVMRKTLEEGSVPDDWRTANVSPIYKKGPKHSPGNYRPVSLTSVCCKMM